MKAHNVKTAELKLRSFASEIGLTDDEILLLIFSSIDHDYLTNLMILSSEFTQWFNINFEGENRDEIDFLEEKAESWQALVSMSKDVVNAYQLLMK